MKFIIHTQYYPPETGAPQGRLSELAERLVIEGHEVTVLTAMPNYPLGKFYPGYGGMLRREMMNGVAIIRTWLYPTKSVRFIPRLTNYFSFVISSLILGAALLPRADFLLTESPPLFLGIAGYFLSRLKRARWIFNVSDLWPESAVRLGIVGKGLSLTLSEQLELFCYRKAALVTGQSKEILNGVSMKAPKTLVYHFSNGVDSDRFTPEMRSGALHEQLGEGAECVAVYAGLHGIAQGLDQVVAAAKLLNDLKGKLKIVFIGDGPEKEALMHQAKGIDIITFLPPRSKEEMPQLLASSDIAIIPLKIYIPGAVPSKIYEAMASALPLILVAEGEAVTIAHDADAGIVVPPGDVAALAQGIRRLITDRDLRQKLGENGRNAAVKRFSREKIIKNLLNFLEEQS